MTELASTRHHHCPSERLYNTLDASRKCFNCPIKCTIIRTHFAVFAVMNDGVHLPAVVAHQDLRELACDPRGQRVRLHQVVQLTLAGYAPGQHLLQRSAMQRRVQVPLATVPESESLQFPLNVGAPANVLWSSLCRVAQTVKALHCCLFLRLVIPPRHRRLLLDGFCCRRY